jgi:hypothetical protein
MFNRSEHGCGSAAKKGVNYAQSGAKIQPRLSGVACKKELFIQRRIHMKVETYLFGSVEVSPEKVITFPNGLVAFEDNNAFHAGSRKRQRAAGQLHAAVPG